MFVHKTMTDFVHAWNFSLSEYYENYREMSLTPSESMVPIKHRLAVSCSRAGWALSGSSAEEDEIWGWNQLAPVTSQQPAGRSP